MTNGICCWLDLARAFEKDYDVIMPDARGHGKSSVPDFGYRYEDHANDVAGFINALNLPKPTLLGHSMGGMTAAVVASLNPNLLRGLILADPTFISPKIQREVRDSDVADQHRKKLKLSLDEMIADTQNRHPNRSEEINKLFAEARLQTSMAAFDVLTPPSPDYKMLVNVINVPSLIVYGDRGVVSSDDVEELQQINPKLQAEQLRDAGHSIHFDQPERFAATVGSFMRSLFD
jgi:pimeloyl-ACP methyl ester carboxylesterase